MIYFGELHGNIWEKENQIQALRHRIPALMAVDEKLKLSIAQECREEALEIAKEIKSLREKNETDSAILAKAQEISERWNIPLDEFHQLEMAISYMEKHIAELELAVEKYKKSDPKKFETEKNSPYSRIGQIIRKLEHARISLKNHQQAKVAVEVLVQEQREAE